MKKNSHYNQSLSIICDITDISSEIRDNWRSSEFNSIYLKTNYNRILAALDTIDDVTYSLNAYLELNEDDYTAGSGIVYILVHGALQSFILQQDAVVCLQQELKLSHQHSTKTKKLRKLRNDVTGHPTDANPSRSKNKYRSITRGKFTLSSFQYVCTQKGEDSPKSEDWIDIDMFQQIDHQLQETKKSLQKIQKSLARAFHEYSSSFVSLLPVGLKMLSSAQSVKFTNTSTMKAATAKALEADYLEICAQYNAHFKQVLNLEDHPRILQSIRRLAVSTSAEYNLGAFELNNLFRQLFIELEAHDGRFKKNDYPPGSPASQYQKAFLQKPLPRVDPNEVLSAAQQLRTLEKDVERCENTENIELSSREITDFYSFSQEIQYPNFNGAKFAGSWTERIDQLTLKVEASHDIPVDSVAIIADIEEMQQLSITLSMSEYSEIPPLLALGKEFAEQLKENTTAERTPTSIQRDLKVLCEMLSKFAEKLEQS